MIIMKTNRKILVATITIATLAGTSMASADFWEFIGKMKNFGWEKIWNFQNINSSELKEKLWNFSGKIRGEGSEMGQRMGRHGWNRANPNAFAKLYKNATDEIKALIDSIKAGEELTTEQKTELREYAKTQRDEIKEVHTKIREIMEKYHNWEELTQEEKDYVINNRSEKGDERFQNMLDNDSLSQEIKNILTKKHNLQQLTEEEEAILKTHREERQAEMTQIREIMKKYRNGEELTNEEKELIQAHHSKRVEKMDKHFAEASDEIKAVVEKIRNLETLTDEDKAVMQEYRKKNRGNFQKIKNKKEILLLKDTQD